MTAPNPSSYRPLALTSAVAKAFETLLNSHFIRHLESNSLLSVHQEASVRQDLQGNFFPILLIPGHPLLGTLDKSFIVTLDISKAFDRIWHKALLDKLPAYGFTPSFCKLISGFLSNRFISVVVDGATCASFPVSSGVPQGSYLSPTLFFSLATLAVPLVYFQFLPGWELLFLQLLLVKFRFVDFVMEG